MAQDAGVTARAALVAVVDAAKKWQADAVLTNISSLTVDSSGASPVWDYAFFSARSGKFAVVSAKDMKIKLLEVRTGLKNEVAANFMDSDKAMSEARKHGAKGSGPSMGLTNFGWAVNGGFSPGDVSVWVHARTGAFLKKEVIPQY